MQSSNIRSLVLFYVCLPANINYVPLSLYECFDDKPKSERAPGKPETGIRNRNGNGNRNRKRKQKRKRKRKRNGTGTVMWRGTDTRTGTSFTFIYFNFESIYMKNKKTSLLSCSPLKLYIFRQREGQKSRKFIVLSVNFFTVSAPLRREMIKS